MPARRERRNRASLPCAPQGVFVADHQARIRLDAKAQDAVIRRPPDEEARFSLLQPGRGLPQAFDHESIMAMVAVVRVIPQTEKHDRGLAQLVRRFDGQLQSRIVLRALRMLHSIIHAASLRVQPMALRIVTRGLFAISVCQRLISKVSRRAIGRRERWNFPPGRIARQLRPVSSSPSG